MKPEAAWYLGAVLLHLLFLAGFFAVLWQARIWKGKQAYYTVPKSLAFGTGLLCWANFLLAITSVLRFLIVSTIGSSIGSGRFFSNAELSEVFSDIGALLTHLATALLVGCILYVGSIVGYTRTGSRGGDDTAGGWPTRSLRLLGNVLGWGIVAIAMGRFIQAVWSRWMLFTYLRSGEEAEEPAIALFVRLAMWQVGLDGILVVVSLCFVGLGLWIGKAALGKQIQKGLALRFLLIAVLFLVRSACLVADDNRWSVASPTHERPEAALWILAPALDQGLALVVVINLWILVLQEEHLFGLSGRAPKIGDYEAIPLEDRS